MADADITAILASTAEAGITREQADRIFQAAYRELKSMAAGRMRGERREHTLQPTALVHEVYLRLVDPTGVRWQNRSQFFGIAARAMRQVLVDHARRRSADKRGGGWERVLVDSDDLAMPGNEIDSIDLENALARLAERHERMARVVELRVFAGLTGKEIAAALGISRKTAIEDWRFATLWLRAALSGENPP
jgi:RNA polymerase sigma factor (TIGR02999 family)